MYDRNVSLHFLLPLISVEEAKVILEKSLPKDQLALAVWIVSSSGDDLLQSTLPDDPDACANAALCLQELHERVNHLAMLTSEAQARFGLLSCAPPPMMAEPVLTR